MCVPDVCSRCVFTRVKQVGFRCVERSPTTRGCEGMKQGMKYHCMMCLRSVDGIARIVLLLLLHTHTKHTHRSQKGTRSFGSASRCVRAVYHMILSARCHNGGIVRIVETSPPRRGSPDGTRGGGPPTSSVPGSGSPKCLHTLT